MNESHGRIGIPYSGETYKVTTIEEELQAGRKGICTRIIPFLNYV